MKGCIYKERVTWKQGIVIKSQLECRVSDAVVTKGFCLGCKCGKSQKEGN